MRVSPGAVTKYFLMFTAIIGQSNQYYFVRMDEIPGEGIKILSWQISFTIVDRNVEMVILDYEN